MSKLLSTLLKRSTLMATSFILAVSSLSAAMPLFLSNTANAISVSQVTANNLNGWYPRSSDLATGGDISYVVDPTATNTGALKLTTSSSVNSIVHLTHGFSVPLGTVTKMSYDTKQISATDITNGNATLRVSLSLNGGTTEDEQLMFEPYFNGFNGTTQSGWQTWDLMSGKFWSNYGLSYNGIPLGPGSGSYATNFTLNDVLHDYPSAKVIGLVLSMGSYNVSQQVLVDNVTLNDTAYDFEPFTPPAAAAQVPQTVLQPQFANAMNTWTYQNDVTNAADPTATVNHEIVANPTPTVGDNGAVKLNGSVGDKWNLASLQYSGTKLSNIAALGFSVRTSNPGSAYINLDVDFNNPGITSSYQGRLVYVPSETANTWTNIEAVASNGMWKWSNMITGANSAWPDGNTTSARSWNDIVSAFPDATITAVNNSAFGSLYLRSDGTSTTYYDNVYLATNSSNVKYNFELPDTTAPAVPINMSPADGTVRTTAQQTLVDWSDVTDPSTPVTYFYQSSTNPATNGVGGSFVTTVYNSGALGVSQIATPNTPEGTYYWHVKACDALANCSAWSNPWRLNIDNTAPVVVINSPTGSLFNSDVQLKGTVTDLNLRHYWLNIKKDGVTIVDSTVLSSGFTNKLLATLTQDGDYVVTLAARDSAGGGSSTGNRSTDAVKAFTIDKTASAAPTNLQWLNSSDNSILGANTNQNPTTPAWDAPTTGTVSHYEYSFRSPTSSWSAWSSVGNVTNLGPNSFYGAGNTGTEGEWQYKVRTINNFGVASLEAYSPAINYDRTAPVVAITTSGTQATATPTISGTVGADVVNLVFKIDGAIQPLTWTAGGTTWSSTPTAALSDGLHNMSIVAKDSADNEATHPGTITISISAAPTIFTAAPAGGTGTQTPAPTPQAVVAPGEVLGDQTTNTKAADSTNKQDTAVLGDTTGNGVANWFGLAWYWWVLIVAAIVAAWWAIAVARRRNAEN